MSKFNIGDHVEVIKRGYAIERGKQGKVIGITHDDFYQLYEIQSGDTIGTVPELYLQAFTPGDKPNLAEILDHAKIGPENEEEKREVNRLYKLLTVESFSVFFAMAAMYQYGKTRGIMKERQRVKAKKKTAHSEE